MLEIVAKRNDHSLPVYPITFRPGNAYFLFSEIIADHSVISLPSLGRFLRNKTHSPFIALY